MSPTGLIVICLSIRAIDNPHSAARVRNTQNAQPNLTIGSQNCAARGSTLGKCIQRDLPKGRPPGAIGFAPAVYKQAIPYGGVRVAVTFRP